MGRTLPTVNQVLEENREQWARFYRALRHEDRELLDRLFDGAKYFTAACVYQANVTPTESIFLAMLLHLQKQIQELQTKREVPNGTPGGMDSRSLPDPDSDGCVGSGPGRKPPLLLR
jgi:hypothetical protein